MALRNQPYLPLYVNDFMNDEKLKPCSAESTGVYIRVMCLLHKCDEYGVLAFNELDARSDDICYDFARVLLPHLPYALEVIQRSLVELVARKVLLIDNDRLLQKRMVRDGNISAVRVSAGSSGGKAKAEKSSKTYSKHPSKTVANSDIDIVDDNDIESDTLVNDLNSVLTYAAQCGFKNDTLTMDKINLLYADYGKEKMLYALGQCNDAQVTSFPYLRKVLENYGTAKQVPRRKGKTVVEQQYNQREYNTADYDGLTPEEIAEALKYEA